MRRSLARAAGLAVVALAASARAATYRNPVVHANTPDPGVSFLDGAYYAVTTSLDDLPRFPIRSSRDLASWNVTGFVFSAETTPGWAVRDFWAPEMHWHPASRQYLLLFTARNAQGSLCVGLATAPRPLGPWKDIGRPLITGPDGVIDANFFHHAAANQSYILWKTDGNAFGHRTPIWIARLADSGVALEGDPVQLISNDLAWEGLLVEGPWLLQHDNSDFLFLFYSGTRPPARAGPGSSAGPSRSPSRARAQATSTRSTPSAWHALRRRRARSRSSASRCCGETRRAPRRRPAAGPRPRLPPRGWGRATARWSARVWRRAPLLRPQRGPCCTTRGRATSPPLSTSRAS